MLLITSLAMAAPQDVPLDLPTDTFKPAPTVALPETPNLPEGINMVPTGVVLLMPDGSKRLVALKSWLLPDAFYREALTKAKQLAICEPALDSITEKALGLQQKVAASLDSCSTQFDSDEAQINDLTAQVGSLETRALVAEDKVKDLRGQRNVAWAVAGGLVLGAVSVSVVALAP